MGTWAPAYEATHTGDAVQAIGSKANATTATPDLSVARYCTLTATGAGVTIAAPLNVPSTGTKLVIDVTNASGGALTITWNAVFKQSATAPADTKRRAYEFVWDGTNWVQLSTGLDL